MNTDQAGDVHTEMLLQVQELLETLDYSNRIRLLRCGDNPHQIGMFLPLPGPPPMRQVQGKGMSHTNIDDCNAAANLVNALKASFPDQCVAVVIKHGNPSGVALRPTVAEAYNWAVMADRQAAFGGVVALSHPIGKEVAGIIAEEFREVLLVPRASDAALAVLAAKKDLRVLVGKFPSELPVKIKFAFGGILLQTADTALARPEDWKQATKRAVTEAETRDLLLADVVCKYARSNAIVLVKEGVVIGIGSGQQKRVDALKLATRKAADAYQEALEKNPSIAETYNSYGAVMASEAFLPFDDTVRVASGHGVVAVLQPGGSKRDGDSITAADEMGMAMVFTGIRHFRHD